MIKSVWKPITKKRELSHYEILDNTVLLQPKGVSGFKVIWVCDDPNCRTPDKLHSINAGHLIKPKMCYQKQICRPCQTTGEGNGRFGDNRKWCDFFSDEQIVEKKKQQANRWKGELNPSKLSIVKIKKNQSIIDEKFIRKICEEKNFSLLNITELNGKKSKFSVECSNGHISDKIYSNFTRKLSLFTCHNCYYESLGLKLTDDELLKYENYKKLVRILTAKTYKLHKDIINPNNFVNSKWDYHIDHKFSISEGFKNNVNPNIISAKENLEMLKSVDNLRKCGKCSITLDELLLMTEYLYIK